MGKKKQQIIMNITAKFDLEDALEEFEENILDQIRGYGEAEIVSRTIIEAE